ncbi:hypothetical protein K2P47_04895 [Patescibacteria group bacterium]|nr:hypothetical protein [Patescibacteria group bacterium]
MNRLTIVTLIIGTLFAVIHVNNEMYHLYWYYPGLEYVMHVWGGVVLYLLLQLFLGLSFIPQAIARRPLALLALLAGGLITWELYGIYRYGGLKPDYVFDTSLDLVFGILGCTIGWLVYRLMKKNTT